MDMNPIKPQERSGDDFGFPKAAGVVIRQGALVMLAAGVAMTAAAGPDAGTAATYVVVGIADRARAAADTDARVRRGVFHFKNSAAGDAITLSEVGQPAFVVGEETVAKTSDTNLRPKAGTIVDVDSTGVWVRVGV